MRYLILALVLSSATAAAACEAGDDVTFTREEDGALFNPDGYGQTPEWFIYRGLFNGRTAYLAMGAAPGTTEFGKSAYQPPDLGITWHSAPKALDDGQFIGNVYEGPLQGLWHVTCQATN